MTGFLSLLFSPSGSVGRAVYWIALVLWWAVVFSFLIYLGSLLAPFRGDLPHGEALLRIEIGKGSPEETREAATRLTAAINSVLKNDGNQLLTISAVLLVCAWCHAMIEIKRWHDRGYSGAWFLIIRIVPALFRAFAPPWVALVAILLVAGWAFVQLALLPGTGVDASYSTSGSGRRRSVARVSRRQTEAGVSVAAVLIIVRLAIFAYFHLHPGAHAEPAVAREETQATPAAAPVPLPELSESAPPPKPALDPSAYRGTSDTNFGRDWVILDGQKITGIMSASPAPDAQVALLYADGGKNVPASSLPQGFLNAWNLSPARFEAADNP